MVADSVLTGSASGRAARDVARLRAPPDRDDRRQFDKHAAAALCAYASDQRAKVDALASVLEDIAAHGYPSPETGVLWEDARDGHLQRRVGEQPRVV
ncbi:hypothetical protein [Streptomyces misionensis]|uniref:hypothetical protein n=1 Tax=Streptomyces misionensis TaxID=67331 RepID=UPI0036FFA326